MTPRVLQITSRRIVQPLLGAEASFEQRLDWLEREVADQLCVTLPSFEGERPLSLLCSTTLSKLVSGCETRSRSMLDVVESRVGLRPAGLLEAYQCAGWGFALRFAAGQTRYRRLLLSIVDHDLHDFVTAGYEAEIGRIGFGVTTVSLDLEGADEWPSCDGPAPNHGFMDLLHAVRAHQKRTGPVPVFLPFLPEGLAGMARGIVGETLRPNRHDHYGHVFGSDPWIGLAEWLQSERLDAERLVTLGAFAYDGYFTLGSLRVDAQTQVELREDAPCLAEALH